MYPYIPLLYRIAGNIGGDLNLAVWRSGKRPPNLNPSNLNAIHVNKGTRIKCFLNHAQHYAYRQILIRQYFCLAAQDQTAKFKDRQYFRLYGSNLFCVGHYMYCSKILENVPQ